MDEAKVEKTKIFGTTAVFLTAISTILGAILFLRFGYAVGTLGFLGVLLIILVGHLVTVPTALAISELATNQHVEGGGEYYIISRSFGLNIGATIGIALYLSQAISVAFYVIAFTEAFEPFFNWIKDSYDIELPRQIISLPAMTILAYMILKRGANLGIKALYAVVSILIISLILFFIGKTEYSLSTEVNLLKDIRNMDKFFIVFAICFPAFTGMTAGVGLSGDLRRPERAIPIGTITATLTGMITYVFISWKMTKSASVDDLITHQLIMREIAVWGTIAIPVGLAASTMSSAIGSIMVAPRTLQALAHDKSFPFGKINTTLARGKGPINEPFNASIVTIIIAYVFVALGTVNAVAKIISMFFMITYGSLCLISFLYQFGADPSYRPSFKSKWYFSLIGFIMCFWLLFKISTLYAIVAIIIMIIIYLSISYYHRDRRGLEAIFRNALFQLNRKLHLFIQKSKLTQSSPWRPSAVCISKNSFKRDNAFNLLNWISYKHGFGTYIHLIEDYFSESSYKISQQVLQELIKKFEHKKHYFYIDTIISPSYTSAIAQTIQLPGISGMENNMIIFEFDKKTSSNIDYILNNYELARAANYDVCILAASDKKINFKNGIHAWIQNIDFTNVNLIVLLSYIILSHPDWKPGQIKIFEVCKQNEIEKAKERWGNIIKKGRLPILAKNIQIIPLQETTNIKQLINEKSASAGLTLIGFVAEQLKLQRHHLFTAYEDIGDILFVNANDIKKI